MSILKFFPLQCLSLIYKTVPVETLKQHFICDYIPNLNFFYFENVKDLFLFISSNSYP